MPGNLTILLLMYGRLRSVNQHFKQPQVSTEFANDPLHLELFTLEIRLSLTYF